MLDTIKKRMNIGLEVASSTKDKVEIPEDQLIEREQVEKEKKSKAVKEIFQTMGKKEKEFEEDTRAIISEVLSDIQVVTQEELKELNGRIADLEKILSAKSNGNEEVNK